MRTEKNAPFDIKKTTKSTRTTSAFHHCHWWGNEEKCFIEFAVKSKGKHLDKDSNNSVVLPSTAVFVYFLFLDVV